MNIQIWVAGASNFHGNENGGWAWGKRDGSIRRGHVTNANMHRMDLEAVFQAIVSHRGQCVLIMTSSEYVINGATRWLRTWKRRSWITSSGTPVKNRRLWELVDGALRRSRVQFQLTRHGSGDPMLSQVYRAAYGEATRQVPRIRAKPIRRAPVVLVKRNGRLVNRNVPWSVPRE